jgi:hypothetical protein
MSIAYRPSFIHCFRLKSVQRLVQIAVRICCGVVYLKAQIESNQNMACDAHLAIITRKNIVPVLFVGKKESSVLAAHPS